MKSKIIMLILLLLCTINLALAVCKDTDGKNIYTRGTTIGNGIYIDECNNNVLTEIIGGLS